MFSILKNLQDKPAPFSVGSASELWQEPHIARQMLQFHLDTSNELASRNHNFISDSLAFIKRQFSDLSGLEICDFGSGPGLYALPLAKAGAKVTAIDLNPASIRYLKDNNKGLDLKIWEGNYLEFESKCRFDLILLIYCDIGVLSPANRARLLSKMRSLLKPDGKLMIDAFSPALYQSTEEKSEILDEKSGGFWSENEAYILKRTYKYDGEDLFLDRYFVVREQNQFWVNNWLQCFTPKKLQLELEAAGFKNNKLFGDVAGNKYDPDATQFAYFSSQ